MADATTGFGENDLWSFRLRKNYGGEGHKVTQSMGLRYALVSLARASGYRCFGNYS